MLKLLLLFTLLTPENVRAHLEHKAGQGQKPSVKKLTFTRGCFSEIQEAGCPHPKENFQLFRSCLDQQRETLSESCQGFFIKLYGKRNRQKE